jgi:protocatechuate 3,4-dioxygenase beta subunit
MSLAKKISLAAVALAILSTVLLVPWRDEPTTTAGGGAEPVAAREPAPATSGELSGGPADSESRIAAAPSAGTEPKSASEAEATGSLVAHVVWEDDKTPAPGITVSLYRAGADALFEQPTFASDEHGAVRFARLDPGRVHLMILRGEANWGDAISIEAGREAETTLSVGPGMNCKGHVVDAAGRPIEGAEVLVAGWAGGEALPLACTAADGTFSLRAIATHCHVGARAPGYAASALRQFTGGKGAEVELKITLEKNAVELSGTVVDPDRRPVAGAVVQAGSEDASMVNLPDGGVGKRPMHARVRTDAQGRFRFESLLPGSMPVAVRARGLAPSHQTVELEPGRPLTIRVQLEPGVILVGSVRDTQGAPVPRAELSFGEWENLGHRQVLSDEKGEFRVDGLASGEWKARAESDAKGKAEATLRAAPGATLRWDAVLSSGLELHGLVLDADGKPAPRAMIEANLEDPQRDDGWFGLANTDSEGRFTLKNCSAGRPLRIDVRRKSMFPELRLQHVVPGADELVVRLPKEAWIHIQGTVLDPEGKPLASVGVSPFKKGGNGSPAETADPKTGVFRLGPYPPGDYEISLQAGGYPRIHVPSRTVAPDETWDVGTLRFERGGTIVVDVAPFAGESAPEHRRFNVLDASGSPVETIDVAGGVGHGGPFAPGSYLLQYSGEGVAAGSLPFEIRAGSELRFDVALARGSPAEIECSMPEGTYSDFGVQVVITNSSGAPVFHGLAWATGGPMKLKLCLRPGEYRIEARRDSLRGEAALGVPADGSPVKASVVLAPR